MSDGAPTEYNGHAGQSRRAPRRRAILSFGSGIRLISEDHLLDQLGPMGMTKTGLRKFFKVLHVPTIEIGTTRFVELSAVQLAIKAITRIGERDFLTPGCRANGRLPQNISEYARELDMDAYKRNWRYVLVEVMTGRKYKLSYREATARAESLISRMVAASVHLRPQAAQLRRANRLVQSQLPEVPPETLDAP